MRLRDCHYAIGLHSYRRLLWRTSRLARLVLLAFYPPAGLAMDSRNRVDIGSRAPANELAR